MTEEELRLLICRSQKEGFKALFRQYQNYVYSIIWRRIRQTGTIEDAEECISDVFAEVFIHFDDINTGSLKAYIGTVANRTAVHKYRKLISSKEIISDNEEYQDIADNLNIEEDFEKSEKYRNLYEKILSLGEPDSTIIIHKFFYDRKSGDIAKYVSLTPVAVRVRLNRALKRLRKLLTDEND